MANGQRNLVAIGVALLLVGGGAACGSKEETKKPSGHEEAGRVVELSGRVTAEWKSAAGEGMRALAKGDPVFADDTVVTDAGASVTILLAHNHARWVLGGGKRMALVDSASWNAPPAKGESMLAGGKSDDDTAVAGRHAEREAADTAATALASETAPEAPTGAEPAPEPTPAPAVTATPPPAPPPPPTAPPPKPADAPKPRPASPPRRTATKSSPDQTIEIDQKDELEALLKTSSNKKSGRGPAKVSSTDLPAQRSRADILKVVRSRAGEVRRCYQQAVADKPGLAGRVVVKIVIAPSGAVTSAAISSSTVDHKGMEACLVARIESWKFPAAENPTTLTYPFQFSAE